MHTKELIGILFSKLFRPTVSKKNCGQETLLKFEAEDWEN
jgi:hypothetical protein